MIDREALSAAFDTIDGAVDDLVARDCDGLASREQLALLERCEKVRRRLPAIEHPLINGLARQATAEELGGTLSYAIAESVLISRASGSAVNRLRRHWRLPRRDSETAPWGPVKWR